MFNGASVEQNKVEHFGPFTYVFLPLRLFGLRPCRSSYRVVLGCQVLKQTDKAFVLDIGGLTLKDTFNILEVVVNLVGLLHVGLIAGLKDTLLALLGVEEPQFDGNIHWVFKLLDSLLHRAEV